MNYRALGRTGWNGLRDQLLGHGLSAVAGSNVTDAEAMGALRQALDSGINFLDTADVYGGGRSERHIAQL